MIHVATLVVAAIALALFNGSDNLGVYVIFGGAAFYGLTLTWLSSIKSVLALVVMLLLFGAVPAGLYLFLREYHSLAAAKVLWEICREIFSPCLAVIVAIALANKIKAKFPAKPVLAPEQSRVSG